ncbi:hypothetical protein BU16DRAFT_566087 [Lophium mytilinum]|uniref:Uncharacterized protein n=1 Tax=Lophium mytilinum TaxID=390894 RepID=A0A6A6QFJ7_9PEZI|nr:hypothetical protein BU16DRAFT_566087 [Lophium mytilinum]
MNSINFGQGVHETPFFPEDQETNLLNVCLTIKAELIASGTQGNDGLPQPSLTNEIHPLFKLSRWVTGPNQDTERIYNRLKPALRLASLLLTNPKAISSYWPRLLYGHHVHFSGYDCTRDYLEPSSRETSPSTPSAVSDTFLKMSKNVSFLFMFANPARPDLSRVFGITCPGRDISDSHTLVPFAKPFKWPRVQRHREHPTIGLHHSFYDFFAYQYLKASTSLRYRQLFVLAQTLVHEVAHAFSMFVHPERGELAVEPWYCREFMQDVTQRQELGWTWERYMFGGALIPINNNVEDMGPLAYSLHHRVPGQGQRVLVNGAEARFLGAYPGAHGAPRRMSMSFVTMEWVAGWFTAEGWREWEGSGVMLRAMGGHLVLVLDQTPEQTLVYVAEVFTGPGEEVWIG